MEQPKKSRRDRKDGFYIHDPDAMHAFMPYLMPNRADNEATMTEIVDLTKINEYLRKKNEAGDEFKYTFFHVIVAAFAKTLALRPKMNRFYAGHRLYQRKDILFSFIVKKKLVDDSEEALAIVKIDPQGEAPIEQIHSKVKEIVYSVRVKGQNDDTTDKIDILNKLPRPILRFVMRILRWLDYHGKYPRSLMEVDPYYTSVFFSNLGSIKMNANYHHLANWGTNSIFALICEKKMTPVFAPDGSYEMRETLELGLTIDERIADGLYFANTLKILRKIFENPEMLDQPIETEIES